ncbi:sigma-54 dependent transcriptional regulator [Longimicrobium sp.]|uniref:sigma-54 interaction domain-containing protein n=1 Tax=Longimicrobium sp. TaxID=2029185 RepID=UPI002E330015|nr:sigma-54 dependent transcriptional regulator [Longimicrobium sp.]HEX6038509.1 sigma-54 dependent transcriptional regulator [Longimicrobium sp.]
MDSLPRFSRPAPLAGRVPAGPERHAASPHRPRPAGPGRDVPELVGGSRKMAELRQMIELVAPTASTVLITGETGTGKEVVARRIHALSERPGGPFVAVNCAALPESLIESELFGYERGAFTGAAGARPGYFEEANGGTLFLDEVAELPLALQPKLLRALQEREVRRLGAQRSVRVDVRVIAATNADPACAVRQGRLRSDLYYRLCIIELRLPPLRERKEDIPQLCEHFLGRCIPRTGSPLRRVGAAAVEAMDAYPWPGNVRELENVIERALVLARLDDGDAVLPCHLPAEMRAHGPAADVDPGCALDLPGAVRRVRRHYLAEALRLSGGNKVEAARILGISRRGLYDLLAEEARSR